MLLSNEQQVPTKELSRLKWRQLIQHPGTPFGLLGTAWSDSLLLRQKLIPEYHQVYPTPSQIDSKFGGLI